MTTLIRIARNGVIVEHSGCCLRAQRNRGALVELMSGRMAVTRGWGQQQYVGRRAAEHSIRPMMQAADAAVAGRMGACHSGQRSRSCSPSAIPLPWRRWAASPVATWRLLSHKAVAWDLLVPDGR